MNGIVVIRGAGDVSTGSIQKIHRSGFKIIILESDNPLCIRRTASLTEAIFDGNSKCEDLSGVRATSLDECYSIIEDGKIPLIVDKIGFLIPKIKPLAVIDATISKKNIGTNKSMAPITIALGPGYEAGVDVDYVIETNRGHNLGRIIFNGFAAGNTSVPGNIEGYTIERVYYSPVEGIVKVLHDIGSVVQKGEVICMVNDVPVKAKLNGLVRGMIREGTFVREHVKIADIDPRVNSLNNCFTISDKARNIGGGVLEALLIGIKHKNIRLYQNDKGQWEVNVGK